MQAKPIVYFFRSLNTAGEDLVQIGPMRLGHFWSNLSRELNPEVVDFRPVKNIGGGSLFEQADRALNFLLREDEFFKKVSHRSNQKKVHFFGHSAGGLVMKLVAQDPRIKERVGSLISIGTPHQGTPAAQWVCEMDKYNPRLAFFLRTIRYNVLNKRETFKSFEAVTAMDFDFDESVFTGSLLCAPSPEKWSYVYQMVHKLLPPDAIPKPCDGLIELKSQRFGKNFWNFELDHIQQMGFGGQRLEFLRLCRFLSYLWVKLENRPVDAGASVAPSLLYYN